MVGVTFLSVLNSSYLLPWAFFADILYSCWTFCLRVPLADKPIEALSVMCSSDLFLTFIVPFICFLFEYLGCCRDALSVTDALCKRLVLFDLDSSWFALKAVRGTIDRV